MAVGHSSRHYGGRHVPSERHHGTVRSAVRLCAPTLAVPHANAGAAGDHVDGPLLGQPGLCRAGRAGVRRPPGDGGSSDALGAPAGRRGVRSGPARPDPPRVPARRLIGTRRLAGAGSARRAPGTRWYRARSCARLVREAGHGRGGSWKPVELHEYASLDAVGLRELIRAGEVSAAEVEAVARRALHLADADLNALALPLFEPALDHEPDGPLA